MRVPELRALLHEKVRNSEEVSAEAIAMVNTPERMEVMKQKTRDLVAYVAARLPLGVAPQAVNDGMQVYDALAIDWVYGDELEWDGSLADRKAAEIRELVRPKEAQ